MTLCRFDDREFLFRLLKILCEEGFMIENIGEQLAEIGPVDLDLLVDCLDQLRTMQVAPAPTLDMRPVGSNDIGLRRLAS